MKRTLIWFGVVLTLVLGVAIPSHARHLATTCRTHNGPDGPNGVQFRICLHVNAHDGWLALGSRHIQAKTTFTMTSYSGAPNAVVVRLEDLVLFRGAGALRYTGTARLRNWVRFSYATGWYVAPRRAEDLDYTASLAYRLVFRSFPGDPTSARYTLTTPKWWG